jgi:hypothetical protein
MAFNRDWLEVNPIDHTKFKEAPGAVRNTKVDVSDRLKDILSGFVSGETAWGIKLGKYLTQGTAAPSAPSGTGANQDMNFYIRTDGTGTYADAYLRGTTGGEIRLTIFGRLCINNARMSNDTYILGTDTNGAAQNILKVNTANAVEFASHIFVPNTNPASALVLVPKGYVDARVCFGDIANKTSSYGAQQAATDGIITANTGESASTQRINGFTDSAEDPTTQVACCRTTGANNVAFISFPVKRGDYWKVTLTDGSIGAVYWTPIGS